VALDQFPLAASQFVDAGNAGCEFGEIGAGAQFGSIVVYFDQTYDPAVADGRDAGDRDRGSGSLH
jgi:hypothetical protein